MFSNFCIVLTAEVGRDKVIGIEASFHIVEPIVKYHCQH